jgi:hypothetical protein
VAALYSQPCDAQNPIGDTAKGDIHKACVPEILATRTANSRTASRRSSGVSPATSIRRLKLLRSHEWRHAGKTAGMKLGLQRVHTCRILLGGRQGCQSAAAKPLQSPAGKRCQGRKKVSGTNPAMHPPAFDAETVSSLPQSPRPTAGLHFPPPLPPPTSFWGVVGG